MKRGTCIMLGLTVLVMLVILAALAGPASAKAVKTEFTTISTTLYDVGDPVIREPHNGSLVWIVRDDRYVARDVSSDPRLTGLTYGTQNGNANLLRTLSGVMWGTYRTVVGTVDDYGNFTPAPTGDVWEGTYTVKVDFPPEPGPGVGEARGEGRGVAGTVVGLLVKWTAVGGDIATENGYIIEK